MLNHYKLIHSNSKTDNCGTVCESTTIRQQYCQFKEQVFCGEVDEKKPLVDT